MRSAALVSVIAIACGSYRPPGHPFAARPPAARDWAAALALPPKITIETFETGRIRVRRSQVLDLDDPKASGLADDELDVPVFAHLLHHDDYGDWLIDAGLDASFQHDTSGDMRGWFAYKVHAEQRPGEDVAARLAARGIRVRGVFFTHLHPDHLSGAASLPRDLRYIVGKGESPKSASFLFHEDALEGVGQLEEIDFSRAPAMPPLGPAVDVFGDGSLWAIATPGHTDGHVSYLVNAKTGPLLLTGDASHTRWGFEHGVKPGKFNDGSDADAQRSFDQLRAFARAFPTVHIIFGHSL